MLKEEGPGRGERRAGPGPGGRQLVAAEAVGLAAVNGDGAALVVENESGADAGGGWICFLPAKGSNPSGGQPGMEPWERDGVVDVYNRCRIFEYMTCRRLQVRGEERVEVRRQERGRASRVRRQRMD
jgi:hypothetical protein